MREPARSVPRPRPTPSCVLGPQVPTLESEGAHGYFTFADENPEAKRRDTGSVDAM